MCFFAYSEGMSTTTLTRPRFFLIQNLLVLQWLWTLSYLAICKHNRCLPIMWISHQIYFFAMWDCQQETSIYSYLAITMLICYVAFQLFLFSFDCSVFIFFSKIVCIRLQENWIFCKQSVCFWVGVAKPLGFLGAGHWTSCRPGWEGGDYKLSSLIPCSLGWDMAGHWSPLYLATISASLHWLRWFVYIAPTAGS